MQTVPLSGVAVPLSRLVLGTMTFGDTADERAAARMVDAALDAGITAIDTANGYAGTRSEQILATLLTGRRDRIVLASKAGIYPGDAAGAPLLSPDGLRRSLQASLGRLGVDDLDIYYLHQPDRSVPLGETIDALGALIDEGLIRAYGVSNYAAWQVCDLIRVADAHGVARPVLAQQMYSLIARRLDEEYAEFARSAGLPTLVYNPLGGGLLSGRHAFADQPTTGRFGDSAIAAMYRERYWNRTLFDAVTQLSTIAADMGVGLPELALRWLMSTPVADAILIGASKVEHLMANIAAAAAGPLPADVVARCDEVGASLVGPMPAYNR